MEFQGMHLGGMYFEEKCIHVKFLCLRYDKSPLPRPLAGRYFCLAENTRFQKHIKWTFKGKSDMSEAPIKFHFHGILWRINASAFMWCKTEI